MTTDRIIEIIERHESDPGSLIQVLLDIQGEFHWLSEEALQLVSERLHVPISRVRHTVTFYKAFSLVPKGRHEISVCMGTACHVRGAPRVLEVVQQITGIQPGETDAEMKFSLNTVNCLGCCALGPVMEIDEQHLGKLVPAKTGALLKNYE